MSQEQIKTRPLLSQTTSQPGTPPAQINKWVALAVVAVGVFMANLDSSIVTISLPAIAHAFGISFSGSLAWIIIAYLMVIAGVLLTVGRLADTFGHKPIWMSGLLIFTLGSLLCGAAPNLPLLIGARGLQGLGAAGLMAVGPAILTGAFPQEERGRALGLNAVTVALGISLGPTLGGLITQQLSWRGIFAVNVPLGLIGLVMAASLLSPSRKRGKWSFDLAGALCLAIALVTLTVGLSFGLEWGWRSLRVIGLFTASVVALLALVAVERKSAHPILPLAWFANRLFLSTNGSLLLSMLALFSINVLLPFYLQDARLFSPIQAGMLLTPLPLTLAVFAPLTGSLADRLGTRWLATAGLVIASLGLVFVSQLNMIATIWDIAWRLVLVGLGQALFQSPNNSALMGALPRTQQGSAAGFMATSRIMGQSLSVAIAGAIFTAAGGATAATLLSDRSKHPLSAPTQALVQHTFFQGFQVAFLICAAIALSGALLSLLSRNERSNPKR